jgi:peptide deformylase
MAIRPTLQLGHPALRAVNRSLDAFHSQALQSPEQNDELRVYCNPKIIWRSSEQTELYEGCGSVLRAHLFGPVERPAIVTLQAQDVSGKTFQLKVNGILGRVIQHEFDHLQGVLFTDLVADNRRLLSQEHYLEYIKTSSEQQANSKITIKELSDDI